jgi:PhoPQ-activated pathogenicity-related protein
MLRRHRTCTVTTGTFSARAVRWFNAPSVSWVVIACWAPWLRCTLLQALLCVAVATAAPAATDEPGRALAAYVSRADDSNGWREIGAGRVGNVEYVELVLTSQTWRGITWKHQLFVLLPHRLRKESSHALLFISGGRWKPQYETMPTQLAASLEARIFARLAETVQAPVAVLKQVPHQPLFGRREDALIAYSFDRYLATGEADWPLLLPMVKSAVRGMDTVQQVARQRWGVTVDDFTVAGASKRGWTTWLTAAVDPRVVALAPIVIDVLNIPEQIDNQIATWGALSEQIRDYSDLDIPARLRSEARGAELLSMVDPYAYRSRLTQSKLILLATNDPYWPLDALRLYWPSLLGPKSVLYIPNQGHSVRDTDRLIGSIAALHRYAARNEPLPALEWSFVQDLRRLTLRVRSDRKPDRIRLWRAASPTRDFRSAQWSPHSCRPSDGGYSCSTGRERAGFTAAFAELTFKDRNEPTFSLSTTVCMAPPPDAGTLVSC